MNGSNKGGACGETDWARFVWPVPLISPTATSTGPAGLDTALPWHDQREVFGFSVKSYFFDPRRTQAEPDFCRRMLPVFQQAEPVVWVTDSDRRDFRAGNLIARPDAVLIHGNCLLSLEYKTQSGRQHVPDRWHRQIPTAAMLQCLAAAIAVAVETKRTVAPILCCHNAMYMLAPRREVVSYLLRQARLAPAYWGGDDPLVAAGKLAKQCEPWLRETYRFTEDADRSAAEEGRARHQSMLRL